MSLGDRLKHLRINKSMTQKELANKVGISERVYAYYEQGRFPKDESIIKSLANALDTTASFLLGEEEIEILKVELEKECKEHREAMELANKTIKDLEQKLEIVNLVKKSKWFDEFIDRYNVDLDRFPEYSENPLIEYMEQVNDFRWCDEKEIELLRTEIEERKGQTMEKETKTAFTQVLQEISKLKKGESKEIECPKCHKKLFIAKNKSNGHIFAKCEDKNCIFMIQ